MTDFFLTDQIGISDLDFVFMSSPLWMNEAVLRNQNSMGSILAEQVLETTHLDSQKTVPITPCVSQMLDGSSGRHSHRMAEHSFRHWMRWE